MIIWINGPFGVGKTQTAYELQRRLPDSIISDPEQLGRGIHRMQPTALRGDFQDLPLWRTGVRDVLAGIDTARTTGGRMAPTIVPMTLVRPDYFEQIVGDLQRAGHDVRHFSLLADPRVVRRRLRSRGESLITHSWASSRIESCLTALARPMFGEHVPTDTMEITEVAEFIGRTCELPLLPDSSSPVVRRARRAAVQAKTIRRT